MAALLDHSGRQTQSHRLDKCTTVGRAADNTIELQDSAVSSHHAVIRRMPSGEYLIQDLESSNGTYVAGVRIRAKKLDEGDEICMGGVVLRFTERSPMPAGLNSRPIATPPPELLSRRAGSEPGTGRMPLKTVSMTVSGEMPAVKPIWERNAEETVDFAALDNGKSTNLEADFAKLQTAYELIRSIAGHDDLDTILDSIVTTVLEKLDVDRAAILIASAKGPLVPRVAKKRGDSNDDEFTVSTSILSYVIENRKAVVIDDLVMDSRFAGSKSLIMQAVRAAMCVPMLHNGQLVGVIHMDSTLSQTSLDEKHLDLMTTIANTAAFAVKTALLKEQITHMERERAEAISAMISGASHFINNPLAVVRSNMGMFEEWSESLTNFHSALARSPASYPQLYQQHGIDFIDEELQPMAKETNSAAGRIADIVTALGVFQHKCDPDSWSSIELSSLIEDVLLEQAEDIAAVGTIHRQLVPVQVRGVRERIKMLLEHIVRNAREAIPKGDPSKHWLVVSCYASGGSVFIAVDDTGRGLPDGDHARLFAPFGTDRLDGALGLGLAVAAEVERQHRGRIELKQRDGGGTRVLIEFPDGT